MFNTESLNKNINKDYADLKISLSEEGFTVKPHLHLVKESKVQGINSEKILKSLPEGIAQAITKSIGESTTPYLENILYSLNKLNEGFDKNSGNGDVVDKLF